MNVIFIFTIFNSRNLTFPVTDVIDCTGTINGIDPMAIVTLSDDQFIPGTTTFRHLEVTEVLEVCLYVSIFRIVFNCVFSNALSR